MRQVLTVMAATMIVAANVIATKIVPIPFTVFGTQLSMSAGVVPIAVTFLCTDIISERYGKEAAYESVKAIVVALVLALLTFQIAVHVPHAGGVPQEAFSAVLDGSTSLLIASICTVILSQTFDVTLFHRVREYTSSRGRWTQNIVSTMCSQFVDTTVFTVLGFAVLPVIFAGPALPWTVIKSIIVVEYTVKITIALFDTPLYYYFTNPSRFTAEVV